MFSLINLGRNLCFTIGAASARSLDGEVAGISWKIVNYSCLLTRIQ